jgi:hypothetical protein
VSQSIQTGQDAYAKHARAIASAQEDKIDYWLNIPSILARDDVKQLLNAYTAQWEDLSKNFSPISAHRFCACVADALLLDRSLGFNRRGRYDAHKYHDRLKVRGPMSCFNTGLTLIQWILYEWYDRHCKQPAAPARRETRKARLPPGQLRTVSHSFHHDKVPLNIIAFHSDRTIIRFCSTTFLYPICHSFPTIVVHPFGSCFPPTFLSYPFSFLRSSRRCTSAPNASSSPESSQGCSYTCANPSSANVPLFHHIRAHSPSLSAKRLCRRDLTGQEVSFSTARAACR